MASRKKRGIYQRGDRYWIDFTTFHGDRIREPAGFSLAAAERLLAKRRVEAEEIDLDPRGRRVTLRKYAATYLERARGRKKSWERDEQLIAHLNAHLGDRFLIDITPQVVEGYQAARLEEESKRQKKKPKPATVNREVACLKRIMALAVRNGVIRSSTIGGRGGVEMLGEHFEARVITESEYAAIRDKMPAWARPVVVLAYWTAMRRGELLELTWDRVDVKGGFIRLPSEVTKTAAGRSIPLSSEAVEALSRLPRPIAGGLVFTKDGEPIPGNHLTLAFRRARQALGLEGVRFHDFRHTRVTLWRRAGHDYHRIMAATGHKTMHIFQRYSHVDEHELEQLKGPAAVPQKAGGAKGEP